MTLPPASSISVRIKTSEVCKAAYGGGATNREFSREDGSSKRTCSRRRIRERRSKRIQSWLVQRLITYTWLCRSPFSARKNWDRFIQGAACQRCPKDVSWLQVKSLDSLDWKAADDLKWCKTQRNWTKKILRFKRMVVQHLSDVSYLNKTDSINQSEIRVLQP